MKTYLAICLAIAVAVPALADKSIPELILDLGVQDRGNHTCNTAAGILVQKGDEAVPHLEKAITNPDDRVQHYAIRSLGHINTASSRKVLIAAFASDSSTIRHRSAYALAWNPHPDAEDVYIAFLSHSERFYVRYAIKALGEIKSKKALLSLKDIVAEPNGWHDYYASLCSIRKIENNELPQELSDALEFLRKSKYAKSVDESQLVRSVGIIKANLAAALPDVFNVFLWVTKGKESKREPNAKTILRDAGETAYPYIKIGLNDPDYNINRKTKSLVEELGIEKTLKKNL